GDGDGYGDELDAGGVACDAPVDTVDNALDCDDGDIAINPDGDEVCDPEDDDEDCNGLADDADSAATGQVDWYVDADGDGYGDDAIAPVSACDGGAATVLLPGDCDDTAIGVNPDADEVCDPDDVDEDCDGFADDADPDGTGLVEWCPDADGDGFGDASAIPVTACASDNWVADCTDCDDAVPGVNPLETEIWYDGLDQDCDGNDDDQDLDTYTADAVGGPDCDDLDATVHPGADEQLEDGVDQDCDGTDASVRYGNAHGVPGACGCGSGSTPVGWLWVPLLAIAMRRRAPGEPQSPPGPGRPS
ncbi:MAG: putative metal-binding motif-containing protein, partial [Deltaproteobacteria bacterium]|nr:putative metal-binding motif-containing protein [Deltaproteobacteria bacterium]